MKFKNLLIIFFLSITMIFAGCSGSKDCSEFNNDYERYSFDEELKECVVYQSVQKDICGNGVIDGDDTFCSCPADVPKTHPTLGCSGELGDYLEKSCSEELECSYTKNNKVVLQPKSIEFKNNDLNFKSTVKIDTPFVLNTIDESVLLFETELFQIYTSNPLRNINVRDLTIKNRGSTILGSITYDTDIQGQGSKLPSAKVNLGDTNAYKSQEDLIFEMIVSYTVDNVDRDGNVVSSDEKLVTLSSGLGRWTIINPNFFEE